MSILGKGNLSYHKQDTENQRDLALGFRQVKFAHLATAGAGTIDLTNLIARTSRSLPNFTTKL